jgi:hypothetical protein
VPKVRGQQGVLLEIASSAILPKSDSLLACLDSHLFYTTYFFLSAPSTLSKTDYLQCIPVLNDTWGSFVILSSSTLRQRGRAAGRRWGRRRGWELPRKKPARGKEEANRRGGQPASAPASACAGEDGPRRGDARTREAGLRWRPQGSSRLRQSRRAAEDRCMSHRGVACGEEVWSKFG